MNTVVIRDKHLKLNQNKIDLAKKLLGTKTETEAIERALDLVIQTDEAANTRREVVQRILARRAKMKPITDDTSEWIRQAREERDERYGL